MNRFEYASASLSLNETHVARELGVKIYDGDQKVPLFIHLRIK